MSEINIPPDQRIAVQEMDLDMLAHTIEQCLRERRNGPLLALGLWNCGPFVAAKLRDFETALTAYAAAKSRKKVEETEYRAERAGSNLSFALRQMKEQVQLQEREDTLFRIDDHIMAPYTFSNELSVRVSFRWRPTIEDEWAHGAVVFTHAVSERTDYTILRPKRKPSAATLKRAQQENLYRQWDYLMMLGLWSVKEHFRAGGSGAKIPQKFQAIADPYSRGLNNHSLKFWLSHPLG